ncbi:hypothetical protein COS83_03905 [archaeon CG07_land_8_20_14_0_80_38_8]|nr:MAG: hypothetical protein COS83_03905 [archaeon CG07_land_8_20_14_0_80_38_8]PIU88065.1 MAG: hypothetical protein COS64_04805 [archaeon CG06_land_8_20_14_3_00_37_11]
MAVKKKTSFNNKRTPNPDVKRLREQMNDLMRQVKDSTTTRLEENVEELNEQLNKMVSVNINLQSKMTELLIKVTDLVRENRELISLLEEEAEGEAGTNDKGTSSDSLIMELKKIETNTRGMKEENTKVLDYIKKLYTKNLLSKAIKGRISEESPPAPEEGGEDVGGM